MDRSEFTPLSNFLLTAFEYKSTLHVLLQGQHLVLSNISSIKVPAGDPEIESKVKKLEERSCRTHESSFYEIEARVNNIAEDDRHIVFHGTQLAAWREVKL